MKPVRDRIARKPARSQMEPVATLVLGAILLGVLLTLVVALVRDFWVILLALMQP